MGSHFRRNVTTTAGFFAIRFGVSVAVALSYIVVAAGIQYAVVGILGESTFNYIVGGLLSLFLGVIVCERAGALVFMFVRGWHVAALAYVNKIRKSHAPAVTVGMKAFTKNIVGFGAVYGVRAVAKNLLADFKDKLWELLSEVPLAKNLQQVAENPVIEHLASDVLNYGFDATIFYLIKNPPKDTNEIPGTVVEGLKRYLYCLPSIMLTSIGSYLLFRFLPKLLKCVLIFWVFITQGFLPGILITVLMWPVFYILDNAFFSPLTMIMFISCFSKKCDEEVDTESPTVKFVDAVLDGVDIGTSAEDLQDEEEEEPAPEKGKRPRVNTETVAEPSEEDIELDVEPDMSEVPGPIRTPEGMQGAPSWMRDVEPAARAPWSPEGDIFGDLPFADAGKDAPPPSSAFDAMLEGLNGMPIPGVREERAPDQPDSPLSSLLRNFNARDLGQAPYPEEEDDVAPTVDEILSGGDF